MGSDSTLKYILPLTDYTSGFHSIGIRSKDNQGSWSHTQSHSFYVIAEAASAITESEYYIDTDPGYGKAVNPTAGVGSDSALKFVVPLTAQSTGFHIMVSAQKITRVYGLTPLNMLFMLMKIASLLI